MTVATRDPLLGTVLGGRYRLDAAIARGGMSTVYRSTDQRLGRVVAVKVMDPALASDPTFVDRFGREARAAAQLNDRHVVAVYDQGEDSGHTYLVMEFVAGRTLRQVLRERDRLSPAQALTIADGLLSALAAAHRKGLVHRDIKPENILIAEDGAVRVVDFGLARAVETTTITRTGAPLLGTVAYLAPEQITAGHADARSDVYAAGIVLFEMLTGVPPHDGDTSAHVAFRHVNTDVPAPSTFAPEIPAEVDDLVLRATSRDPAARPVDGGAFLSEVGTVRSDCGLGFDPVLVPLSADDLPTEAVDLTGLPASRPAEGEPGAAVAVPDRRARRARRRKAWRGVLAGLVVVTIAALLVGLWWMSGYTAAPRLVGMSEEQAAATAEAAGFTVVAGPEAFSETVPAGMVAETVPAPGDRVREGGEVEVRVSKGKERYTVPEVRDQSRAEAEQALAALNLQVADTQQAYDDAVPAGEVITTKPEPGTQLRRDDSVTLVVSQGPAPVELPDLVGSKISEVVPRLTEAGLKIEQVEEFSDDVVAGTVISQDPGPSTVLRGATVTVVVSKGPEIVTVPNLSGLTYDAAARQLQDLGLTPRRAVDVPGGSGKVLQQQPSPGDRVPHGTTISLFVF